MGMKIRCYNNSPTLIDERLVREQRTMSNVPVFVGLDYHQDSIQVCVLNQQGDVLLNRSAGNDCQELGRLVAPLGVVQRVGKPESFDFDQARVVDIPAERARIVDLAAGNVDDAAAIPLTRG